RPRALGLEPAVRRGPGGRVRRARGAAPMTAPARAAAPLSTVTLAGRLLVVRFARPHATLSWAPVGGGRARTHAVAWRQVDDGELGRDVDPEALLTASLADAGLDGAVGMLTARSLSTYHDVSLCDTSLSVRCVATVGLGNALAAGDPPG